MTTPDRDHLDAAIDHVAARMVAVPDDGELTLRIVTALPERTSRLRWLMPQLAAIGAFVIAALIWTTRNNTAPALATLPSEVAPIVGLASAVTENGPGTASRTLPLEHMESLEPMEPVVQTAGVDHERALSPIDAVSALVVTDLAPPELPATPALELAPIEITDLPLTAESFPPR